MSELPRNLYSAAETRALDRIAIDRFGIPGYTLMTRAGVEVFAACRAGWPDAKRLAVVCGLGNNAGDGYVVARLAHEAGLNVAVYVIGDPAKLTGDASQAANDMKNAGVQPVKSLSEALASADLVVDAIFGTGLDRDVSGEWFQAIEGINRSQIPVVAVDIPSGLHADTGVVLGIAVRAQLTVSFIGLKRGMVTGAAREYCGVIRFSDLDVPSTVYQQRSPSARMLVLNDFSDRLAPRARASHKGHHGHVLVVGGDYGMVGAVRMAAEAAARVGAGLVSVATRRDHAAVVAAARPELMCHRVEHEDDLDRLMRRAKVVAVGPGLGCSSWGRAMFASIFASDLPLVVDADALNILASATPHDRGNWVITPHPAEAGRLLGLDVGEVETDRFAAVRMLQVRFKGVAVLKGSGTLVCPNQSDPIEVCVAGNPGMASGGMGDVLTGVIAGLIAQGLALHDAARLGVCVHSEAADMAARDGERGTLATDLLAPLRRLVNP